MSSFITQALTSDFFLRKGRSTYTHFPRPSTTSKTASAKKFEKIVSFTSDVYIGKPRKNTQLKKTFHTAAFSRETRMSAPQKKWNKIVDLFNIPVRSDQQQNLSKSLRPGLPFYRLLANPNLLKQYTLYINFPETFLEIQGQLFCIATNKETRELESFKMEKQKYIPMMHQILEAEIEKLANFHCKYKDHYDYRKNVHAPVIVTKIAGDHDTSFEVDVESYKIFQERRSKPTTNKLIQRFIYSRNMQAMILRVCYHRKGSGQFSQQFFAYRFQNVDNIFRVNKKNNQIYQTFKLQSTINATYDRQGKVQFCKLTNMKGLQKFIQQSKELIWFLQHSQKIQINKIYIDYTVDLYNNPWLLNLKKIQYTPVAAFNKNIRLSGSYESLHIAGSFGLCRLCSLEYLKKDLKKTISNKMLVQYLSHLKKRMNVPEYQGLEFVKDIIKTKTKNYMNLQVCERCYTLVVEQYKLIEQQRKLAKICNIQPEQIQTGQHKMRPLNMPDKLKQWRLMLYIVGISNLPSQYLKEDMHWQYGKQNNKDTLSECSKNPKSKMKDSIYRDSNKKDDKMGVVIKYKIGNSNTVQQSWRVNNFQKSNASGFFNHNKVDVNIKKIKIHYFYSQAQNIDNFLKETEISFQLATPNEQKIIARGSSSTLSSFKSQYDSDLCLRQTSSVLLFYNNGQYCELTIKVGLICDGLYQVPGNVSLAPLNKVYFAQNSFANSNSIPRQWMQAFGVSSQFYANQVDENQLVEQQRKNYKEQREQKKENEKETKIYKKLSRKSFHLYK